jgi:hypothetical protein
MSAEAASREIAILVGDSVFMRSTASNSLTPLVTQRSGQVQKPAGRNNRLRVRQGFRQQRLIALNGQRENWRLLSRFACEAHEVSGREARFDNFAALPDQAE